jgi:hypothetical protein
VAIGPLDPEVLRLVPHLHEQQLAARVGVAVLRGDAPAGSLGALARLVEQVAAGKPEFREDLVYVAGPWQ